MNKFKSTINIDFDHEDWRCLYNAVHQLMKDRRRLYYSENTPIMVYESEIEILHKLLYKLEKMVSLTEPTAQRMARESVKFKQ